MHIALIRRRYDPNGGGAEKVAARFVEQFLDRGHRITVFAETYCCDDKPGLNFVQVKRPLLPTLCKTAAFHQSVQKICNPDDFDLVYAMSRTFPADVFRVAEQIHAEWLPINYPAFERLNPRHRGILSLERRMYRPTQTRHVVTNSNLIKQQIINLFDYPAEQISVVRNGIDRKRFYPAKTADERQAEREKLGLSAGHLALLFVAGNYKIKGLKQALTTIAGLPDEVKQAVRLIIAGGDKDADYRKLAGDLGIEDKLLFVGKQNELRPYYILADLLFYPSLYEPFANVCLEAAACKLPILTTRINGASELVEHEKSGYIVDNADCIDDMRRYISEFYQYNNDRRATFAEAIFEATKSYSWQDHVDQLEHIFTSLMTS